LASARKQASPSITARTRARWHALPLRATPGATLPVSSNRRRPPVAKPYVRLTQPLVRDTKGGELRPAAWDEALAKTVEGFTAAKAAHGPTTFGTFSCSKATNEVNFPAQKFTRPFRGTNKH